MTYNTINDAVTMQPGATGTLLAGRYRVVRQLGQGGMGSVWLAEDTQLDGKLFAIKMLPSILVSNKRAYRQLKDEALVAMQLVHPNIVQIRAFEENNGNPFLVMDYIEGQTLDDYLAEKGNGELGTGNGARTSTAPQSAWLPEDEVIRILKPIAAALDYAHKKGVVHRDVKPGNVMVAKDGTPYILDFGIAREIQETMTRVTGKLSSGTLLYMSPEQLNGEPPKPAQDVYSFAAMVYECLKGEPPFSRGNIEFQIMNKEPEPLVGYDVPIAPLADGVMAGLAKKPEDRPPTCVAVLNGDVSRRDVETRRNEDGCAGRVEGVGGASNDGVRRPTEPVRSRVPGDRVGRAASPRPPKRSIAGNVLPTICIVAALLVLSVVLWHRGQQRKQAEWMQIVAAQNAEEEASQRAEDESSVQGELDEGKEAELLTKVEAEASKQAKEKSEAEHRSKQKERTELLVRQNEEDEKRIASLPDRNLEKYWAVRLEVANNYFGRGQKSECMKIYDEFFKAFEKPPAEIRKFYMEVCYTYGQLLARDKQYAKAVARYEYLRSQFHEGDDIWCNLGCEAVEIYLRLAEQTTDPTQKKAREGYLKAASKIVDKLLEQLSKPVYFARAVSMKAHIEQGKGDVDRATEIIDEYKPQLQDLHDQIVALDPEGKQGLLLLSPLPECMYLQAEMRWDEAKKAAGQPKRNDDRIKDLMFGPKGKNGRRVGSKGAFNIAVNVFLNYKMSTWAPAAGVLSEEMRTFAEKEYCAKIKTRVTVEQIATLASAKAAESQRAEKYDDAIRNWRIIASTYTNTSFYANSLAQLSYCYGKLGDRKLEIEYINRHLTIETVKMRRLQAQLQLAQIYKNDGLGMLDLLDRLDRAVFTNIVHEDAKGMGKEGTAQLIRAIKMFSDVTKEIDAALADSSTNKADVDNYKELREVAMFMVGECWSRISLPEKNIEAYRKRAAASYEAYLAEYPDGKYTKMGYVKLGIIYTALNEQEKSKDALSSLLKKFPDSDEANKVRQGLVGSLREPVLEKETDMLRKGADKK